MATNPIADLAQEVAELVVTNATLVETAQNAIDQASDSADAAAASAASIAGGPVASWVGLTGAVGLSAAKTALNLVKADVGLSNVDNTADANKPMQMGQCELILSGANLKLTRKDGSYLFINGNFRQIPSVGVDLPVTGAAANTTYYVYASWSGSAIVLSFSAAIPVVDTTYGHKVKTGDATMTLVGMARTNVTPAWVDNQGQRFVLSWFNQKPKTINVAMTSNYTTSSTTYVSLSGQLLTEFLHWENTSVRLNVQGSASVPLNGQASIAMEFDFTAVPTDPTSVVHGAGSGTFNYSFTLAYENQSLSEGYHACSLITFTNGTGSATFNGASSTTSGPGRCVITGSIMG